MYDVEMSKRTKPQPTPEEEEQERKNLLQQELDNSGHNLHLKVVRQLQNAGWHTDLCPYYCDDTTSKPREIDIVASKKFPVTDDLGRVLAEFACWLYIECKRFNHEIAFRTMPRDPANTTQAIKVNWFPSKNPVSVLENHHHYYLFPRVGKLHKLHNIGKKTDNERNERNDLFDAITQPVKSLVPRSCSWELPALSCHGL